MNHPLDSMSLVQIAINDPTSPEIIEP